MTILLFLIFSWLLWCIVRASLVEFTSHKVEVIEHTLFPNGVDAITFRLCYWRAIHGELMTHRVASRNAKSSRAIPIHKTLAQVWSAPFGPINWGTNKPGMQAGAELTGASLLLARTLWVLAGRTACCFAWVMMKMGGHKQWVNRILEPWQSMVSIFTFSDFSRGNFLELRDHKDAQPEFRALAHDMGISYYASKEFGMRRASEYKNQTDAWHLPLVNPEERASHSVFDCIQMSTARCARASFENFDGSSVTLEKDKGLYHKLVGSKPWHASPTEHQCTNNPLVQRHVRASIENLVSVDIGTPVYSFPRLQGNLTGTIQFRKLLEQDRIEEFLSDREDKMPTTIVWMEIGP